MFYSFYVLTLYGAIYCQIFQKNLQFNVLVHNAVPGSATILFISPHNVTSDFSPCWASHPPNLTEKKILNSFNFPDYRPILP